MSFNLELQEHQPEAPNLLKDLGVCIASIIAIEQAGLERDLSLEEKREIQQKLSDVLGKLQEHRELLKMDNIDDAVIAKRNLASFSGLGGWNRYTVKGDGSILLPEVNAFTGSLLKAQELGLDTPKYP